MRKAIVLVFFLTLAVDLKVTFAQDSLVAGHKIIPQFSINVSTENIGLTYNYTITNGMGAEQEIYRFWLLPPSTVIVSNLKAPEKWYIGVHDEDFLIINCVASDKNIKPGSSLSGFSFRSASIPGIISFYAEGEHRLPKFEPGMATDSIPGYSDLTPYGPGVVGKTVGPILPADPFVAMAFLDTLISYKHDAASLGWVGQEGFVKQLDEKLDQSRDQLTKGHIKQARDKVEEFLKKLENEAKKTEKDQDKKNDKKWVTSEGYALLKFNAEYLIEKLDEQITKKK
jgi:hypothetical protein